MKLLNVPPFKVGDRVRVVTGGNRDYLVTELRNKDRKWEIKLNGWWYTASWFIRINENTTEESPGGAAAEQVMESRQAVSDAFNLGVGNLERTGLHTFQYSLNGVVYSVDWRTM